jgi:hypothetical protein
MVESLINSEIDITIIDISLRRRQQHSPPSG